MKKNIKLSVFFIIIILFGCESQDSNFKRTFINNSTYPVNVSPAADNTEQGWSSFELQPGGEYNLELKSHSASWQFTPMENVIQKFGSDSILFTDKQ